jgi:glycerol 3-phosphatase-2
MDSLLVLTGVAGPADLLGAPRTRRPTYVAADLDGLFAPADAAAVGSGTAGWQVRVDGRDLVLDGDGPAEAALRALCVAAWDTDRPRIRAEGGAAEKALVELGLAATAVSGA